MSHIDLTDDADYKEHDAKHGVMTKRSTLAGAGNGLFATKAFRKGQVIIPYAGVELTKKQKVARYPKNNARYVLELSPNRFLDASDPSKSNLARYANHKPLARANAKLTSHGNITAVKAIKAGAEIFVSYGKGFKV